MSSGPVTRASTNRVVAGLAALVVLACLGAAAEAHANWIAPVAVSTVGPTGRDPQIAVDGKGNVTAAWVSGTTSRSIVVAEHPAGGSWTPPVERISPTQKCHDPRLDVNPAGAAIVIADCDVGPTLRSATRTVNGVWANAVEVPGSGTGAEPRIALDDAGNAVAIWSAGTTVQAAYRPAGAGWGGAVQLSTAGKAAFEPNLAISPAGYAFAVWRQKRENTVSDPVIEVKSSRKLLAESWISLANLTISFSTTPVTVGEPQIEINADGERMAAWSSPGTNLLMDERTALSELAGWSEPPRTISDTGSDVEEPHIALDGNGLAIATWRSFGSECCLVKAATTAALGGSWSAPPATLAGPGGLSIGTEPDVTLSAAGDGTVVWRSGVDVKAVSRPAGGTFGAATTISDPANSDFEEPQVTTDPGGNAIVTWSANDSFGTHIAVAVNDVTPPAISSTPPAPVVAGSAVALSAVATDSWSPVSLAWSFGDGATATGGSISHVYAGAGAKTATVTATDSAGNSASAAIPVTVTSPPLIGSPGGKRHRIVLSATVVKQTWEKIERARAVKLRCKLDVAGTCAGKASVSAAVAKRIGINAAKGQRQVAIGKGFAQATAGRFAVVKLKLTPKALAAIAAATQPVAVKIAITGSAVGSDPANRSLTLKISRP